MVDEETVNYTRPCEHCGGTGKIASEVPLDQIADEAASSIDAVEILRRRFVKTPEDEAALEQERQIAQREVQDFSQRLIGARKALELTIATMQGHLEAFPERTEPNFRENMIATFTELLGDNDKMDQIVDEDD